MAKKRIGRIGIALSVGIGVLVGYVLFQSLIAVFFSLFAMFLKGGDQEATMALYNRHLAEIYLFSALGYAAIVLAGLLIYKIVRKQSSFANFLHFPLRVNPFVWVPGTFLLGASLNLFLTNLISLIPFPEKWLADNAESVGMFSESNLLLMLIAQSLAAPLVEELIFRGVTYHCLRRAPLFANSRVCITVSAILVSAVFGVFHGNILQALYCFVFSLVLVWLVEKSGSIWYPVFAHIGFNSSWFLLLFVYKWYEKTAYMFKAFIFGIIVLVIVVVLIYFGSFGRHRKSNGGDSDAVDGGGHNASCVPGTFPDGE